MREIKIYDSAKKEKVLFVPVLGADSSADSSANANAGSSANANAESKTDSKLDSNANANAESKTESKTAPTIRFYVCGPTVYDDAHLGHARSAVVFDLWRRLFVASGYRVIFAKNFTDIDDKIIKKAAISGKSVEQITKTYIDSYLRDMDALKILRADIEPKATENLAAMEGMISALVERGAAYKTDNGDIYLSVEKDAKYGTLSNRGEADGVQARIKNSEQKRDARDFALWKSYKGEADVGYESALGFGRPGWHIECSAMVEALLAHEKNAEFALDIHAGGSDLLFPHHENEAAQTRCATGRELAKYWIHNGFVNINGQKMSKSLGNSFFVKDALAKYDGEVLRNYLLGTHYRALINFNEEDLLASKKRLDKIYRLKMRVGLGVDSGAGLGVKPAGESGAESGAGLGGKSAGESGAESPFCAALLDALAEDLNISKALSIIEEMINLANEHLDKNPKDAAFKAVVAGNLAAISKILGLGDLDATAYFQLGVDSALRKKIEELIAKRTAAKSAKDYALADSIRNELKTLSIDIKDTPTGTTWEFVQG